MQKKTAPDEEIPRPIANHKVKNRNPNKAKWATTAHCHYRRKVRRP